MGHEPVFVYASVFVSYMVITMFSVIRDRFELIVIAANKFRVCFFGAITNGISLDVCGCKVPLTTVCMYALVTVRFKIRTLRTVIIVTANKVIATIGVLSFRNVLTGVMKSRSPNLDIRIQISPTDTTSWIYTAVSLVFKLRAIFNDVILWATSKA